MKDRLRKFRNARNRRSTPAPEGKENLLPRLGTLLGFRDETKGQRGVDVLGLEPYTRLTVRTRNTEYVMVVLNPSESKVVIQGGSLFPKPVQTKLRGATYGGSMLKESWIGLGMRMEINSDDGPVVTSPVRSVQAEDESGAHAPIESTRVARDPELLEQLG